MTIRLYDSAKRGVVDFIPLDNNKVSIYVCGATVQGVPHIGHLRTAISFDIIRRWFEYRGYKSTFVRNITDIDDKILYKSEQLSIPWWQLATINENEFTKAYSMMNVLLPSVEPKATAHIQQIIEIIDELISKGYAYKTTEGNVYFDTVKWENYGSLTNQEVSIEHGETQENDKKNKTDFALWKKSKDSEPKSARFESPYVQGRPGWHIECSAMAKRYLGESFDIHGGGLDLRFPHHENELAQSSAIGDSFAKYWIHTAWVTQRGEKMSKSLGNTLSLSSVLDIVEPIYIRFALGTPHYRSNIEFDENKTFQDSKKALNKILDFIQSVEKKFGEKITSDTHFKLGTHNGINNEYLVKDAKLVDGFEQALDDDFNTPIAVSKIFDALKMGNSLLDSKSNTSIVKDIAQKIVNSLQILGVLDNYNKMLTGNMTNKDNKLDRLVDIVQNIRLEARKNKDYKLADSLRDKLSEIGISSADG